MEIRNATKADASEIRALVLSLARYYLREDHRVLPAWLEQTLTQEQFERRLASAEYSNFVYVSDGELAGYISVKEQSHLYHLFVSEKHQGKGLSRSLWEYASRQCPSSAYTVRSSIYAVPVYRRFGFVESGSVSEKDGLLFQPMELRVNER